MISFEAEPLKEVDVKKSYATLATIDPLVLWLQDHFDYIHR